MYVLNTSNEVGLTSAGFPIIRWICHQYHQGIASSLDCFADSEVATFDSEELPGITISYPQLAEFLDKAERLQHTKQPVLGEESIGKKSRRPTKKRKRPPTPIGEISSDKEMEFRDAENAVEGRTVVEDSDFRGQTRGTMDEPVKKMNLRKK